MLNRTRALLLTFLLTLTMAFTPLLHAQEAASEDSTIRNLALGAAAVIIAIIYWKRRNKRKSGS